MNSELLEAIDNALPNLEDIREGIIQVEATNANRAALDGAYSAVADAIGTLEALRSGSYLSPKSARSRSNRTTVHAQ
jgi:hypothetical protein